MSVEVRDLHKRYAGTSHAAVNGVSIEVPAGAITALLGPSGSGKTTLLRCIAGLEVPDSGTILISGRDCTRVEARHRGIGFVFQGYALFRHLSVRENVAFGLKIQKVPKREREARVDELLELIELADFGDRRPDELSGGQRQRVAFARALAPRPAVLLLDEPFGALDARVRTELRAWLRALHERTHVTTVIVTHDQDEALEVAQQVVVMSEGKVEQIGTPRDIYDRPSTPFVASFIGGPSELTGRVEAGRVNMGAVSFAAPPGAANGSSVRAYVRPDEARLVEEPDSRGTHCSWAVVDAVSHVAGQVRVDLRLPDGNPIQVHLTRFELERLDVTPGGRVLVDLGAAKIFVEDYAI